MRVATGRGHRRPARAPRRWFLIVPLAAGIVLGWSGLASAHASVVSSSPAAGAHLAHTPTVVSVVFDQPVKPDDGGLLVLDSNGTEVNAGASTHPAPNTLQAALPNSLGNGAYVANYTVTSVDGHVVSGGIVFLVGNASAGQIGQLARRTSSLAGFADKTGQFLLYLGVLACGGLAFFLAFILPAGPERDQLRRWCVRAATVALGAMVVTAVAQAALTGGNWGAVLHWGVDREAVGGKFGAQCAVQIVGLAGCVWSVRLRTLVAAQFTAFYGTLIAAGAFVLFGHAVASPERWLSIPADIVHVVVAAIWIGGLAGLVVVLRARTRTARRAGELSSVRHGHSHGDGGAVFIAGAGSAVARSTAGPGAVTTAVLERDPPRTGKGAVSPSSDDGSGPEGNLLTSTVAVVARFSTMAGISVALLLVAGVLLGIAEVGSLKNLVSTSYGQILLVKIALVGLLIFMAAYNRFLLLPTLFTQATRPARSSRLGSGWRRLLATVRVEAIGVVAVLAVTAVLANSTPSNGAQPLARPVPFAQTQPFEGGHLSLRISPNQAFENSFVVQFTGPDGTPADKAESVSVYLTLPAENVGPIETDMRKVGVGRFVLSNTPDPPIIGTWQITLQIQVSAFDEPDASFVDNVR